MICEHKALKRSCPYCEVIELYAELDAMEAENKRLTRENEGLQIVVAWLKEALRCTECGDKVDRNWSIKGGEVLCQQCGADDDDED